MKKSVIAWFTKALASCGFISYLPASWRKSSTRSTGAGLVGTAAGFFTARWLPFDPQSALLAFLGGVCISVAVGDYAEQLMGRKDDPRIVIDEWIGYWTTVLCLPPSTHLWLAAFVLFRLLDVWKPLGIRHAARLPGGWGVVMDDIAAGLVGNVLLRTVWHFHPL